MFWKNFFKELLVFFGEIILFLTYFLPMLFIFYFILTYIFAYLFKDNMYIGKEILASPNHELSYLIVFYAGIALMGSYMSNFLRKTEHKKKIQHDKEEILLMLLTSFLLSYYFTQSIKLFSKFGIFSILILASVIFLTLQKIIGFYLNYDLSYFRNLLKLNLFRILGLEKINGSYSKKNIKEMFTLALRNSNQIFKILANLNWKKYLNILPSVFFRLALILGFVSAAVSLLVLISVFITMQFKNYLDYNRRLRENLTITKVKPATTTIGEKVALEGYNFGWRFSEADRLMSYYGPILVELWKENEITFTVPLHWKEGKTKIWIERMKGSIPSAPLLKSNDVELNIMNRWVFYPEQDELDKKNLFTYFSRGIKKIKRFILLKDSLIK